MTTFQYFRLREEAWERGARLRLRALADSPEWFAGDFHKESSRTEGEWRDLIKRLHWIVFTLGERDVGMMTVEQAEPVRGTDCWLAGCWVEPELRGRGITAKMILVLDEICGQEGWREQGLGVWPENEVAIAAYTKNGFIKTGQPQPSRSRPNQLYQLMTRSARG